MKTYIASILMTGLWLATVAPLSGRAAEEAAPPPAPAATSAAEPSTPTAKADAKEAPEAPTNTVAPAAAAAATPDATEPSPTVPAPAAATTPAATDASTPAKGSPAEGGLRLNFRGVPLDMVLDYLSEAAGFIIVKETEPKGKVDVWSNQPLTRDEAVELLNTILNKNDYAAVRNGRTLTIVSRDDAKKRNIPVKKGGDAEAIPSTDDMVTQIIPVRHALVAQLTANLQPLLGTYATMTANESANTLVLTATQADIRRMTEIINALDDSISSTSTIHVFPLRYADAKELATVIKELFAPATQQQNNARGNQFGFGGFPGQGGGGGGRNAAAGRDSGSNSANNRVVAVADERSNSLVVGAPDDLMAAIKDMVNQIDQPVNDVTELRVFRLRNADPVEMADLFTQLFPDDSRTDSSQNQAGFRFNGGRFGGPGPFGNNAATAQTGTSERAKKKGRVSAVADQRTSSIIVSAASELMPQIAEMVAQLDSSPAKKQKVFVYSLENADVQQVEQMLQNMFQKSTTARTTANQNSALANRIQQNSQATTSGNTGFGNNSFGNSGGTGGGQFR